MLRPWAIVPIKAVEGAKQRLAAVLDTRERRDLMLAMAADVLDAVAAAPSLAGVVVVAGDGAALRIGRQVGAEVIEDVGGAGQSAAVALAVAVLAARGADCILALPADIPLLSADEIETVIAAHPQGRAVSLVPARDGNGSNAVAVSPPDALRFRFGPDSRRLHLAEAEAARLAVRELHLPDIGLDIDTPEDLDELLRRSGGGRTFAFLRDSGIAHRLLRRGYPTQRRGSE